MCECINGSRVVWSEGPEKVLAAGRMVFCHALLHSFGSILFAEVLEKELGMPSTWDDTAKERIVESLVAHRARGRMFFTDAYNPAKIAGNEEKQGVEEAKVVYARMLSRLDGLWLARVGLAELAPWSAVVISSLQRRSNLFTVLEALALAPKNWPCG